MSTIATKPQSRISDWRRVYKAMRFLDQYAVDIAATDLALADAYARAADAAAAWLTQDRPKLAQWKRVAVNRARRASR